MHVYLPDIVDFETINRILVIKLEHLGDVLLTTPVFSIIKERYPAIEIDALIYAETYPMLSENPAIDQLHQIDRKWKRQGKSVLLSQEFKLFQQLKQRKYDLVINFTNRFRGAWLTRLLKPRYSVSQKYSHKRGRWWMKSFSHLYSAPSTPRHTVEIHLDALRRLGMVLTNDDKSLSFFTAEHVVSSVEKLMGKNQLATGRYILLHPTSRWMFKSWSRVGFSKVINQLIAKGHQVVIVSGPESSEVDYVQKILHKTVGSVIDFSGQLSLKELAILIDRASCFIGLDSVAMHIASAMKTPCIALFGPSDDRKWHPWEVKQVVLTTKFSCRPCNMDGCGNGKISECLQAIESSTVIEAVDFLLDVAPIQKGIQ